MGDAPIIGIDLGTSFSSAALYHQGHLEPVADEQNRYCIPSVVHYPKNDSPIVGFPARDRRATAPQRTVACAKTILGRTIDSGEFRRFDAMNSISFKAAPNNTPILNIGKREILPIEVAAHIYGYLRKLAERQCGEPVKKAVLTIPVSATKESIDATTRAARQANLDVVHVLTEPVAGALSYGLDKFEGFRKILAYDFGGGTFDVTVLHQEYNKLEPVALGGDSTLGGDDFDQIVAKLVSSHVYRRHEVQLEHDAVAWSRLVMESERVKRELSRVPEAAFRLDDMYRHNGERQDIGIRLARDILEPHWLPLINRSLRTTLKTLTRAHAEPGDIGLVVMIGGSTAMPAVQKRVQKALQRPMTVTQDPQTAVAMGAALMASRI